MLKVNNPINYIYKQKLKLDSYQYEDSDSDALVIDEENFDSEALVIDERDNDSTAILWRCVGNRWKFSWTRVCRSKYLKWSV